MSPLTMPRRHNSEGDSDVTMRLRTTHVAIVVVALMASFLVVAQVRTEQQARRLLGIPSPQLAELAYRMQREEHRRAALEAEIVLLRQRLAAIEAAGQNQRGLRAVSEEVRAYRLLAGFTPVVGPGIVIELRDNERRLQPGENPNEVLLHYTDLARVVGDLWAAGAEAIAINDERLAGTSGIECVGTTILVNRHRLAPPFRVAAIGDPERLPNGAAGPGTGLSMLKAFGFPVRITRVRDLDLPPYRGVMASAVAR